MLQINPISHYSYLHAGLMKFFPADSIASRLKKTIGIELGAMFADEDFDEFAYYELFPVRALFEWLMSGGALSPADLTNRDGLLYDDNGSVISDYISSQFSKTEHIAALGLWFIESEAMAFGSSPYDHDGRNEQGWFEINVLNHKAECLLNAYQALCYANRLTQKIDLTPDEKERIAKFDFSALGAAGAAKRHSPIRALREYAVSLYDPNEWKSANQAAHELMDKIMAHGRSINARLAPSNAQRTIAEWFRKKSE